MGRYITLSAFLHFAIVFLMMVTTIVWVSPIPPSNPITIIPIPPPEEIEEEKTPTPVPTPDLTNAKAMAGKDQPTPTPTPTPTKTKKPTNTPTPTKKPTDTPTPTQTKVVPTDTPKPTDTATAKPTDTPKPTNTPKPTETPKPSNTPEPSPTPTPDKKKEKIKEMLSELAATKPPAEKASENATTSDSGEAFAHDGGGGMQTNQAFGDKAYLAGLQSALQQNFFPPDSSSSEKLTTVVSFTLTKEGRITNVEIYKSSGSRAVDVAAKKAAITTKQFKALPAGTETLDIACEFVTGTGGGQ